MPELPEVEVTARLIDAAVAGAGIESVRAPGLNAVRTFEPPLEGLVGMRIVRVRRRGKLFLLDVDSGSDPQPRLTILVHLMSAGRLQLYDRRASLRDRSSRVLIRLDPGCELRLREFGTKQRAWVKLLRAAGLAEEETLAALGPDAWPGPPDPPALQALLAQPRPLYALLRDQHVLAGVGRSWVDEILHTARLSPFKRGDDLTPGEIVALRDAILSELGRAIAHYERTLKLPIPDKLPMPLRVHRRHGEPCPDCGATLEAVFYEDYIMCYCPACQTGGRRFKDRRLSRLLK